MWMAPTGSQEKMDAAFELCLVRNLCPRLPHFNKDVIPPLDLHDPSYRSEYRRKCVDSPEVVTGETPLVTLAADGGDVDDIALLVAAGARSIQEGMHIAAKHGHTRCACDESVQRFCTTITLASE